MALWRSLMPRSSVQHQTPQVFPLALLLVTPCMKALHQPPSTRMRHHQTSPLRALRCCACLYHDLLLHAQLPWTTQSATPSCLPLCPVS